MIYEFDDDAAALYILSENFGVSRGGMIYPNDFRGDESPMETAAINYLCAEWDYGYLDKNPDE